MVLPSRKRLCEHTEDLAQAFLQQYERMLKIASDRRTFQNTRKNHNKNYKEYACRWKNVASCVQPPLSNREMHAHFMDTLLPTYYDKLVENTFSKFANILINLERNEHGIKIEGSWTPVRWHM